MSDTAPRIKKKKKRDAAKAEAAAAPAVEAAIAKPGSRPGWTVPHPDELPKPTFWPAGLAFAVTLLFWGLVTSPIITAVGALVFTVSLSGWIGDIRNERAH